MAQLNWEIPTAWTTGWTDVFHTGTWRSAIPEHKRRPSPCHQGCPVRGQIPQWVQLLKEERYYDAWLRLIENNPLPAITGRVCHHPCEASCNRIQFDGAIAIRDLERFIGDLALAEGWSLPTSAQRLSKKVAVVGGGPAGLSCAYELARNGYSVTILEKRSELGGLLRWGIPGYRLPKEILRREIQRLVQLGIDVQLNTAVQAGDLKFLRAEYDAVFLATGAGRAKRLPQLDSSQPWVLDGLSFLEKVNKGEAPALGPCVTVIGGGSVAMDVARTARRLGKEVAVLALERREVMPAQPEEVEEAIEEGISLYDGAMLIEALPAGEGIDLRCQRVVLDPSAPPNVLKPVPIPDTNFRLRAQQIIVAIGQDADLVDWQAALPTKSSTVWVEAARVCGVSGIYAGGDLVNQQRFVSTAIGTGKEAARAIMDDLSEPAAVSNILIRCTSETQEQETAVSFAEINTFYFTQEPRLRAPVIEAKGRLADFREIRLTVSREEALAEAGRCFGCGNCVQCDNCFYFCPDMAVARPAVPGGPYIVLEQYCKGCGLCVKECPRGAVVMKEESR